jgi:hypothetical protein
MTTTPLMSLVLPTDHDSNDIWDTILDTVFGLIDGHDHTTGKGGKVPVAGLNINADLSFSPSGTPRAITDLKAIDFAAVASTGVTALAGALFVSDGTGGLSANELYWRTTSGSNVKITLGAALNVAVFSGGIGGDYVAVGAAVAFDDAADRYTFKQQANVWARMASGEVRILETGTTESVYVGLAAPAALAASYSITLPLAAPTAGTRPVQMSTAGVLTAGDADNVQIGGTLGVTGASTQAAITASGLITANAGVTVATAQALTLSGTATLTAGGLITANAGVTAGANQNVTVSGTGAIKHGTKTKMVPAVAGSSAANTDAWTVGNAEIRKNGGVGSSWLIPLGMAVGERVINISVLVKDNATGPVTISVRADKFNGSDTASVSAGPTITSGSGAYQQITFTAINNTVASGDTWRVLLTQATGGAVNWTILQAAVDYDRP